MRTDSMGQEFGQSPEGRLVCLYSTVCGFSWENHLEVYLLIGLVYTGGWLGYQLPVNQGTYR